MQSQVVNNQSGDGSFYFSRSFSNFSQENFMFDRKTSSRKRRRRTTQDQLTVLTKVFEFEDTPSYEEREHLSQELNMTNREVQVWFQNRRAKMLRERLQHIQLPSEGSSSFKAASSLNDHAHLLSKPLSPSISPVTALIGRTPSSYNSPPHKHAHHPYLSSSPFTSDLTKVVPIVSVKEFSPIELSSTSQRASLHESLRGDQLEAYPNSTMFQPNQLLILPNLRKTSPTLLDRNKAGLDSRFGFDWKTPEFPQNDPATAATFKSGDFGANTSLGGLVPSNSSSFSRVISDSNRYDGGMSSSDTALSLKTKTVPIKQILPQLAPKPPLSNQPTEEFRQDAKPASPLTSQAKQFSPASYETNQLPTTISLNVSAGLPSPTIPFSSLISSESTRPSSSTVNWFTEPQGLASASASELSLRSIYLPPPVPSKGAHDSNLPMSGLKMLADLSTAIPAEDAKLASLESSTSRQSFSIDFLVSQ